MSKLSNEIKLLLLLLRNGRMKTKELATRLEVSERMVRKYINDLLLANLNVVSTPGPNGGYELLDFKYLTSLTFTESEISVLQQAVDFLEKHNFCQYAQIDETLKKIKSSVYGDLAPDSKNNMFVKETASVYAEKERNLTLDIHLAIISLKKIKVIYTSISSGRGERVIRPYGIIAYRGASYLVGYCENRQRILSFKVSRFESVEILSENYVIPEDFSLKEFTGNSLGIYNDDILDLKLRINWPMSYIISEKKWVDNQEITWENDETIIFKATMSGKTEIISWILSMGKNVSVLEPDFLKEEMRDVLNNMINNI